MLDKKLFSIIIPTFNSEAVLKDCLESILIQSFKNYEVIIVDGKSSDTTIDIVNIYTKPNTIIKNSIIYAIFNIYTKQNKDSLKNSVFTKIGNIFKNKI